jgi:phage nucleotide-binding protein
MADTTTAASGEAPTPAGAGNGTAIVLPFAVKDPARIEQDVRPNILLYGPPGSGKTTGAASIPGRKLYLNFDLDNATHYARTEKGADLIEPEFTFRTLPAVLEQVAIAAKSPAPPFDVVVIDTVGDMHRMLLEHESNYAVRPGRDAYGDVSMAVERFCRAISKAENVSAVIVCHDDPQKDEESGAILREPFTGTSNPKVGRKLLGIVDIVAYTGVVLPADETAEPEYWAQLIDANGRRGKDRFGVLGKKRRLDLAEWVAAINKDLAEWVAAINKDKATDSPTDAPTESAQPQEGN